MLAKRVRPNWRKSRKPRNAMETPDINDPVGELAAAIRFGQQLAATARTDLTAATPILISAIRHQSGQSRKIEAILWSLWNDDHPVNLCETLSGLDAKLAQAAVSMIAARAHLGGDADDLLHKIITDSDNKSPRTES
jgi:hypothetical protein